MFACITIDGKNQFLLHLQVDRQLTMYSAGVMWFNFYNNPMMEELLPVSLFRAANGCIEAVRSLYKWQNPNLSPVLGVCEMA